MSGYIGASVGGVANAVDRIKNFTITSPTTVLTGLVYKPGYVNVTRNGVTLYNVTDYTATNGTSITLLEAAQAGDTVQVIARASFQAADTVSASAGGTFSGDVSVDADLSVDGNAVIDGNADIDGAVTVDGGITASGGIYLGGTGSDNLLDDYEEGTWTPQHSDGTNVSIVGVARYTKVGNAITIQADIIFSKTSNEIKGLPFASMANANQTFNVGYSATAGNVNYGHMNSVTTSISSWYNSSNANKTFQNGDRIMITSTYFTA